MREAERLLRRAAVYVCVVADMDSGAYYDPEIHDLVRDLRSAKVQCPRGHGGWRHILSRLARDKKNPTCNPEGK